MAEQIRWAEWPNSAPMSYGVMVLCAGFKVFNGLFILVLKYLSPCFLSIADGYGSQPKGKDLQSFRITL